MLTPERVRELARKEFGEISYGVPQPKSWEEIEGLCRAIASECAKDTGAASAGPTEEQICAIGACASLAESMGNDVIAGHVRAYLAARSASHQS